MLYILRNEQTRKVKIVTVLKKGEQVPASLQKDLDFLNRLYPDITIDFVKIEGEFGPQLIQELSKKWGILPNFMFIGVPGNKFPYRIQELGGVRLII